MGLLLLDSMKEGFGVGKLREERNMFINKLCVNLKTKNLLIGIVVFGSEASHHFRIVQLRYRKFIMLLETIVGAIAIICQM